MESTNVSIDFSWQRPPSVTVLTRKDQPDVFRAYDQATPEIPYFREDVLLAAPKEMRWEAHKPFEDSKLLGKFAQFDPQLNEIVGLAREHGFLTQQNEDPSVRRPRDLMIDGKNMIVEGVSEWEEYLPFVSVVLTVQYAIKQPADHRLRTHDIVEKWPGRLREAWIHCNGLPKGEFAEVLETHRYLNYLISLDLLSPQVRLTAVPDDRNGYEMQLQPKNLAQAIQSQLVRTATGSTGLHRCAHCHTFFTASGHRDRMYCSNACKHAASRERLQAQEKFAATTVQQLRPKLVT